MKSPCQTLVRGRCVSQSVSLYTMRAGQNNNKPYPKPLRATGDGTRPARGTRERVVGSELACLNDRLNSGKGVAAGFTAGTHVPNARWDERPAIRLAGARPKGSTSGEREPCLGVLRQLEFLGH